MGRFLKTVGCFCTVFLLFIPPVRATSPTTLSVGDGPRAVSINTATNQAIIVHKKSQDLKILDLATQSITTTIPLNARPKDVAVNNQNNTALVTLDKLDQVRVIDLVTGATLSTIEVGRDPHGVALDSSINRALVTNKKDDTVSLIDLVTNTVTATLPVGERPTGIAVNANTHIAVVTNKKSDTLSFIDLANGTVVGLLPVAEKPGAVAIHPGNNQAIITHQKLNQLSLIDLSTQAVITTLPTGQSPGSVSINITTHIALISNKKSDSLTLIDLSTPAVIGTIAVGKNPKGLDIHPDSNLAVVANNKDDTVTLIDLSTVALSTANPVGKDPQAVTIHSGLGIAIIANSKNDSISILNLPDGEMTATLPVGKDPHGIAVHASANKVLVSNKKDDTLTIIDLITHQTLATIPVGKDPHGVAVNTVTNHAVVTNKKENTVSLIDLGNNTVIATLPVGKDPTGVAIHVATNRALVTSEKEDILQIIDLQTQTIINTLSVGKKPRGIAINGTTNMAVVSNKKDDTVSLIDLSSNTVLSTLPVGKDPISVTIDETNNQALVSNKGENTVSIIDLGTQTVTHTLSVGKKPTSIAFDPMLRLAVTANKGSDDTTFLFLDGAGGLPDTTPPGISFSLTPLPNAAGWHKQDVTISFVCTDNESGVATCPDPVIVAIEGENQVITGTATDLAGNSASSSVLIHLDKTPPLVSTTVSPLPNAAGWNNTDATVTFTAIDALSGVAVVSPPEMVSTEGVQLITGEATDLAGNIGGTSAIIQVDKTAPAVVLLSPLSGFSSNDPLINVSGTASDLQGLNDVSVNGTPVDLVAGGFVTDLNFSEGSAIVTVTATDIAGNTGTAAATGIINLPPMLTLTAPVDQSSSSSATTTVSGTIDDATALVEINGIPASVTGNAFTLNLPLHEGLNLITAVATDTDGRVATVSRTVHRDNTPPELSIRFPVADFETLEDTITVTGFAQDLGDAAGGNQVTVLVNGQAALVGGTSYQAINLPLTVGTNNIVSTATDALGNTTTTSIQVIRRLPQGPMIEVVSGNNQSAVMSTRLPAPLIARVTDAQGQPIVNQTVVFKVLESNGVINDLGLSDAVITDANGEAQVNWTLGTRAGAGRNRVGATAVSVEGVASFVATGTVGAASKVNLDAGNSQLGVAGQTLPHAFVAVVTDSGHNRLANIPVTFTVRAGAGHFDGANTITVNTDTQGQAKARLVLGFQEGIENNVVDADFVGNPGTGVTFVASGRVAGDPTQTRISGVVLDNVNDPIQGVTLSIEGTTLSTLSDNQGRFQIVGVPVQPVRLLADGSTAMRPGTWPQLEFDLMPVPGVDNPMNMPIFLLPLDLSQGIFITETQGGILTLEEIPGFALEIEAGSATFPDGSKSGLISVTPVHADKIPMVPNFGQQPRLIVTIQPAGVLFDPPAKLTLPNVEGLSPGEITELYSFDHDAGRFVSIGPGIVSRDGSLITSEPGMGILKGGWHCGGNPQETGCCEDDSRACPDPDPNDCLDISGTQSACTGESCQSNVRSVCATCGAGGGNVCDGNTNCTSCVIQNISGPTETAVGQEVTYTATACGDTSAMFWVAGGADPSGELGVSSFTTHFTSSGSKIITVGCGGSQKSVQTEVAGAIPINFIEKPGVDTDRGTLRFDYSWESSTENTLDLGNCQISEHVTYPGPDPFIYPTPPFGNQPIDNPTENWFSSPAIAGATRDNQFVPGDPIEPYDIAGDSITITAIQKWKWRCTDYQNNQVQWFPISRSIVRTISKNADGTFKFTVTKSGVTSTWSPLP